MFTNLREVLENHKDAMNEGDFEPVILDVYLQYGAKGVAEVKELLTKAGVDMRQYNSAIEKIIKTLLKNSDLLDSENKNS